jgi:hypothetical protein
MAKYGIITLFVELLLLWFIRRKSRREEIHTATEKS